MLPYFPFSIHYPVQGKYDAVAEPTLMVLRRVECDDVELQEFGTVHPIHEMLIKVV